MPLFQRAQPPFPPSVPSSASPPPQPKPTRRTTSLNPFSSSFITATPDRTVSIKVPRDTLRSSNDSGLAKESFLSRHTRVHALRRRVCVEASAQGTADAIFFAPEAPNADEADMRAVPCEFVKVRAQGRDDCVHVGDDFEIEFVGMSVTRQDTFGNNDLLLCSLTREDEAKGMIKRNEKKAAEKEGEEEHNQEEVEDMSGLPSSLRVTPADIPFIHYDPIYDGHDVGSKPDTFVAMPGTRRLYLQRRGKLDGEDEENEESPIMYMRFTVMEVDNVSDEQLAAIRSIEEIAESVHKAAASVPYLKIVSSMLKMADRIGKTAIKRISKPDHVMSVDLGFKLYRERKEGEGRQEEFGNYLRYGYYFFLSRKVDAKLYAQTGSSTQSCSLLLRRHGYNPWMVRSNEKEFIPLSGISYVVVKVTRGCSPLRKDRLEIVERHRKRLLELLQKYKTAEEEEAEGENKAFEKFKQIAEDRQMARKEKKLEEELEDAQDRKRVAALRKRVSKMVEEADEEAAKI